MSLAVLKQLCYMLSIAALSFVFARRNKFGQVQSAFASRLLLYFVNPCLILNSFITEYSAQRMKGFVLALAMGLALHLAFTALATLTRRGGGLSALDRIGIVFTNCGFIGIPLINGTLGKEAVFYLMGYMAIFNVYIWIYGAKQVGAPANLLKIFTNPNVLAVIAGIVLFCLPTIPPSVIRPLAYIGEANTALSMILLGMLFAEYTATRQKTFKRESEDTALEKVKRQLSDCEGGMFRRVAEVAILRMVAAATAAVLLTAAVWHIVPHNEITRMVLMVNCIAAICPVGMSVSSFACVFCSTSDKDKGTSPAAYSSLLVLTTSTVAVATIPLFVHLAEMLMKA